MKRKSFTGQRGCETSAVFVMMSSQGWDDSRAYTNASTSSAPVALPDECLTISASNRPYRLFLLHLARCSPVSQSCIKPITNDFMEAAE